LRLSAALGDYPLLLSSSWMVFGYSFMRSWEALGGSLDILQGCLGALGGTLSASWELLKAPGELLGAPGKLLGALGNSWGALGWSWGGDHEKQEKSQADGGPKATGGGTLSAYRLPLGLTCCSLEALDGIRVLFHALLGSPRELPGHSSGLLGSSWRYLECFVGALESSWGALGCSSEAPGSSWELLGSSWVVPGGEVVKSKKSRKRKNVQIRYAQRLKHVFEKHEMMRNRM
jgi:hypothetical protein